MLNGLDLFSGIGGISLALQPWVRTVAYCEIERYAQSVLLSRMQTGELEVAPIWDDVRTIPWEVLPPIDIISGGFPCQDISVAGHGVGLEGERSGLFFEIVRLCSDLRPRFIFLENVPAITVRGLDRVCLELTALGYDSRWTTLSAASIGTLHKRERWWLLAHAYSEFSRDERENVVRRNSKLDQRNPVFRDNGETQFLANSQSIGLEEINDESFKSEKTESQSGSSGECFNRRYWATEPNVCRVVNGLPNRVDRIKGLSNAVVPLQAREAFKRLMNI